MKSGKRGLSLAEAVIAIFIMVSGFVVIFRLFHTAMQYSTLVLAHQQRVRTAQTVLEQVRAWSRVHHQPVGEVPFTDWTYWHNRSGSDVENPNIAWTVTVQSIPMYSPCSLFEKVYPDEEKRRGMPTTYRQVTVTARGGRGDLPVRLTSLVGQPSVDPAPAGVAILLTPVTPTGGGPLTLNRNGKATYKAELRTAAGRAILDVFYEWKVDPTSGDGNGTLEGPRAGRQMDFIDVVRIADPTAAGGFRQIYTPSTTTCRARVRCVYRGHDFFLDTPVLTLEN